MFTDLTPLLILTFSALAAVTLIDVLGSISSRSLKYEYVKLTPVSFLAYGLIGFFGHNVISLSWVLIIAALTGIYDGTFGWHLSIILKANFGEREEYTKNLPLQNRILWMLIVGASFGFVGYKIAGALA